MPQRLSPLDGGRLVLHVDDRQVQQTRQGPRLERERLVLGQSLGQGQALRHGHVGDPPAARAQGRGAPVSGRAALEETARQAKGAPQGASLPFLEPLATIYWRTRAPRGSPCG